MDEIKNYIHGNYVANSPELISVFDPSTGEECAKVVLSNLQDFNQAIESSKNVSKEWSNTTPLKRSRILSKYKDLINRNIDKLAEIISKEHGKTIEDAKGSIRRGLEVVDFA